MGLLFGSAGAHTYPKSGQSPPRIYQSILRLNDFVNGKILRNHTANRHNYSSGQSLKAIVQVEVEAIGEVVVNASPFQWRQVDT